MRIKPLKQNQNRVWRSYRGGLLLDQWQGRPAKDGNTPEEWIGSTVEARGKNRPAGEGISSMRTETGSVSLRELIQSAPKEYLGARLAEKYGDTALLVKLLDSRERLTVQVHPTREFSKKYFGDAFGKTEGWYILGTRTIDGEPAHVYLGFKEYVTEELWRTYFEQQNINEMLNCLHKVYVKEGDSFFIEGGMPHAIGSGCFLLEIQEPTDYTMRVEKTTPDGTVLDDILIHQGIGEENMLKCFCYDGMTEQQMLERWSGAPRVIGRGDGYLHRSILHSEFFSLEEMVIEKSAITSNDGDFYCAVVFEGAGKLIDERIEAGDELFIPAAVGECKWEAERPLRVFICRPPK